MKKILRSKEAINRIFINGKQNHFVTLEGHTPNFQNNSTVRHLNLAKNELGRISKIIIDETKANLHNSSNLSNTKTLKKLSIGSKALKINNISSSCLICFVGTPN